MYSVTSSTVRLVGAACTHSKLSQNEGLVMWLYVWVCVRLAYKWLLMRGDLNYCSHILLE